MLNGILSIRNSFASAGKALGAFCNRSRVGRAALAFVHSLFRSITRVIHVLWLQITGCFFALFALTCGNGAFREYRHYRAGEEPLSRTVMVTFVAVLFAYFAISSFVRASRRESGHRGKARAA